MPTAKQLQDRLNFLVNDSVGNTTTLSLFNECQEDIADVAGYEQTVVIPFTAGQTVINTPADLIEPVYITIQKASDELPFPLGDATSGYQWFSHTLELTVAPEEDGEIKLYYFANLPALENLTDTPAFDARYHRILVFYAATRYVQNFFETELAMKNDFYGEYLKLRAELQADAAKRKARFAPKTFQVKAMW